MDWMWNGWMDANGRAKLLEQPSLTNVQARSQRTLIKERSRMHQLRALSNFISKIPHKFSTSSGYFLTLENKANAAEELISLTCLGHPPTPLSSHLSSPSLLPWLRRRRDGDGTRAAGRDVYSQRDQGMLSSPCLRRPLLP